MSMMDDPLSRALREEESRPDPAVEPDDLGEKSSSSSLSISHNQQDWIVPSLNRSNEEAEIHREQIQVSVCDPKKHKSNLDSFVTYLISTRTFNDAVQINESNVRRRYNDFIWLKTLLDSKYPFHILSPLPMKHTLSKKFHVVADDGEFIRRRMNGLQNFLQRLMNNPVISIDPSVQLFLSADDDTLRSAQQEHPSPPVLSAPVVSTNSHLFGRGKPIPSEFSRTENQIQTLQDNLRKLERLTRKIESDEIGLQNENEHFLASLHQWLDVERKYDENDTFVNSLSQAQQTIVGNQSNLIKSLNTTFVDPINDYVLFTGIVQDVLKRRSQLAESVTNTPNEEMFDQLTIANETIKADIQRWTEAKDKDLIELFRAMSTKKIDFYSQSVSAWEQAAAAFAPNR